MLSMIFKLFDSEFATSILVCLVLIDVLLTEHLLSSEQHTGSHFEFSGCFGILLTHFDYFYEQSILLLYYLLDNNVYYALQIM